MISVSCLKVVGSYSYVCLSGVIVRCCDFRFINIGVTGNDFKTRYRNHLKSLRNEKYKHETELSKHVCNLKKENQQFSIRWAIVKQIPAGRNGKQNCTLCLEQKLMIMKGRSKNILNRRSEMFSKCRHVI